MKNNNYNILQIVKYYSPSKGGMETFVKLLVDNLSAIKNNYFINVYTVNHQHSKSSNHLISGRINIVYKKCIFYFKSQPILFFFTDFKKYLKNADIVHLHFPFPNLEIWLLFYQKYLKEKKFIITWHANIENTRWKFFNILYLPIIERLLDLADFVITTSPSLLENSILLKKFESKVLVIPLSFSSTKTISQHKEYISHSKKRVLFVGKLRKYKGLDYLIEAVKDLDIELFIVGNGEYLLPLKQIVTEYNMQKKVSFVTDADDDTVDKFYMTSDLFVLPSINEAEAFGIVQLEAMSRGLPVINTNLKSGVPFVSLDGLTGFTVNPMNVIELKNSIEKIFSDKDIYEMFSKNALERASQFSIDKMVNSYIEIFEHE
jgi:glycosyltransferase involved in cell wall biosynthesis